MSFNCGIVGLPNVGKSTLFNAMLATAQAEAANYPFCTIEPNVGRVAVPDERLDIISKIANARTVIPVQFEFVDIAGLVKGASKGEGLGNQFLSHIREVDAVCFVLRCFEDDDITHVEGSVDPIRDAEIIETELILADLESLEKRIPALEKKARGQSKEAKEALELIEKIIPVLSDGKPASSLGIDPKIIKPLNLLTSKPVMYVCNVDEASAKEGNQFSDKVKEMAGEKQVVVISAAIEAEISQLDEADKMEFLEDIGLKETGLSKVIRTGYELLDRITFFTAGEKETRGWTVRRGSTAPEAAGEIHTDFQKGFIRAETISYDEYVKHNGEAGAKEAGALRIEGKEYIVKDGDIFHFRFNV